MNYQINRFNMAKTKLFIFPHSAKSFMRRGDTCEENP